MKISQLLVSIIVVLAGGAIAMFSADQKKVMDIVTTTHGGGSQVADAEASGLRKLNSELDTEVARISGERVEAIKASENARNEMRDHRDKRNDSEAKLEADKKTLADTKAKVKAVTDSVEQIRASYNAALETLQATGNIDVPSASGFAEVMEAIKSVVDREAERAKTLAAQLEEETTVREAAMQKLAKEKVELARLDNINDRFFKNYVHNADEFMILAADTHWKFVVFQAGADSGLVAGDSTPLLVKRGDTVITPVRIISIKDGQVLAEFDPEQLPAGLRPEVGDRAFRMKPLGN